MIEVKRVYVDIEIPSTEVGFVTMHPFLQLTNSEPFKWESHSTEAQLQAISRTLDIAEGHAHFTLLPEYSVPGISGADLIDSRIRANTWHNHSVVIAGIDGSTKEEFKFLCDKYNIQVPEACQPANMDTDQWVNCCVIWVKDANGDVHTWCQLKIRPAWPELDTAHQSMFTGSTVHLFEAKFSNEVICRFTTFICFDWVAKLHEKTVVEDMLEQLNGEAVRDDIDIAIHWVFVIQHNPSPNHASFLASTKRFLTEPNMSPSITRNHAMIVHANTAFSNMPSSVNNSAGAFSSCVLAPGVSIDDRGFGPTVCKQPATLRGGVNHGACKDFVFREMGKCIHRFKSRVPRFVEYSPEDRNRLLSDARVFSVDGTQDPRMNGLPVPGAVKWGNDFLDNWERLSDSTLSYSSFKTQVVDAESKVLSDLRNCDSVSTTDRMQYAKSAWVNGNKLGDGKRERNSDQWDSTEEAAYTHMMCALTSMSVPYDLNLTSTDLHGSLDTSECRIQVLAIEGKTHEDCRRHYDSHAAVAKAESVLVIARDRDNLKPVYKEYQKFYDVSDKGVAFLDYQTLIEYCRESNDIDSLRRKIDAVLPAPRRII